MALSGKKVMFWKCNNYGSSRSRIVNREFVLFYIFINNIFYSCSLPYNHKKSPSSPPSLPGRRRRNGETKCRGLQLSPQAVRRHWISQRLWWVYTLQCVIRAACRCVCVWLIQTRPPLLCCSNKYFIIFAGKGRKTDLKSHAANPVASEPRTTRTAARSARE